MSKKIQSYTIEEDLICGLEKYSKEFMISKSRAVERALSRLLNLDENLSLTPAPPASARTEEERLAEWEWRKKMVREGKFPTWMEEEYPRTMRDPCMEKDVYLTPDGLPSDCVIFGEKISST